MADTVVAASLTLDGKQADQSVASFRAELKKAQLEVINLTEKFGATSKEAINAAKRTAELKDRIGDAKKLVDSFNPDEKFRGFTQVLTGVAGGFSAITGAMGLLGVESVDVQKQLLKVQSALAITQGLNSVGDSIQSFKNLGATLVQTLGKSGLIGIAIVGVAALGAAFLGVFNRAKELTQEQKNLEAVSKKAGEQYAEERIKLDALVEAAKDETATRRDRQEAIDKLQKAYPNYLGNIKLEKDGVTGLEAGYLKLVKSIELKATADAASSLATETLKAALKEGLKFGITSFEDLEKVKQSLGSNSSYVAKQILNQINSAQGSYNQLKDIAAKANEQIAKLGGDPTGQGAVTDNTVRKAYLQTHTLVGGIWFTNEELKQAIEDAKIRTQLAAGTITGKVGEFKIPRTPEQLQFEEEAKARHDLRIQEQEDIERRKEFNAANTAIELAQSQERIAAAEAEATAKIGFANAIGSVLDAIATLFGRQTAASKIAALASIAIGTGVAFIQGLDIAQKSAKGTGPAAAFAFPIFYATQIAAILGAVSKAKAALAGTPGGIGSIGGIQAPAAGSADAPLQPRPQVQTTTLDQQGLNAVGNATTRAFVLESDVTSNQERVTRLNRAARLGG